MIGPDGTRPENWPGRTKYLRSLSLPSVLTTAYYVGAGRPDASGATDAPRPLGKSAASGRGPVSIPPPRRRTRARAAWGSEVSRTRALGSLERRLRWIVEHPRHGTVSKASEALVRELQAFAESRCGARARTRAGAPCQARKLPGRPRCRHHGGLARGPTSPRGRLVAARNLLPFRNLSLSQLAACLIERGKLTPSDLAGLDLGVQA